MNYDKTEKTLQRLDSLVTGMRIAESNQRICIKWEDEEDALKYKIQKQQLEQEFNDLKRSL